MLDDIFESILYGDASDTVKLAEQAMAEGLDPGVVLNDAMIAAMLEVGRQLRKQRMFCAGNVGLRPGNEAGSGGSPTPSGAGGY